MAFAGVSVTWRVLLWHMTRLSKVILGGYSKHSGKGPTSVSVRADGIEHLFDPRALGDGPARAILEHVREQIRGITETVSPATRERRQDAGRSGTRRYNDTGKLVKELTLRQDGDSYQTVSPERLAGRQSYLVERLLELVDIAGRDLMRARKVRAAVEGSVRELIRIKRQR